MLSQIQTITIRTLSRVEIREDCMDKIKWVYLKENTYGLIY